MLLLLVCSSIAIGVMSVAWLAGVWPIVPTLGAGVGGGGVVFGADGGLAMLLVFLFTALGVSFLCSLLEAGLLSLPQSHIESMARQGRPAGRIFQRLKKDIDRPLAAILSLNTIAHTAGAIGVGASAEVQFGEKWVAVISVVMTLLILFASEIVPKTLGAVYCKPLAPFTAWTTWGMIYALWPLVWVCQRLSDVVAGKRSGQVILTREEILSVADLGHRHGALDGTESLVIKNLIRLRAVRVKDIMTPRSVVFAQPKEMTVGQLMQTEATLRFARIPVIDGDMDHMIGLVHRFRILEAYRDGKVDEPLSSLASPLDAVPESTLVSDALNQFVKSRRHLFQVVDEYGGTAGIVTLEDAIETLLGVEIVDETDSVTDMRELAQRQAERRRKQREAFTA